MNGKTAVKKIHKPMFTQDNIIKLLGNLLLIVFLLLIIVPVLYILLCSIMDPAVRSSVGVSFDIRDWTLEGYRRVFRDDNIWRGFRNSFLYSIGFTLISVVVTIFAAYPMSRDDFMGRRFFNAVFVFTMFFGGGLMPTYLLMDQLKLINTVWAVLLPGALNVWNLILARSYYRSIPGELREAAEVDGADDVQYFFRVLLPVCTPIISVLCLYQFVAQWNSYFEPMIYLSSESRFPLQLVLRTILIDSQNSLASADASTVADMQQLVDLLKYGCVDVSSIPMLVFYPFVQKHFVKGVMLGAVKG